MRDAIRAGFKAPRNPAITDPPNASPAPNHDGENPSGKLSRNHHVTSQAPAKPRGIPTIPAVALNTKPATHWPANSCPRDAPKHRMVANSRSNSATAVVMPTPTINEHARNAITVASVNPSWPASTCLSMPDVAISAGSNSMSGSTSCACALHHATTSVPGDSKIAICVASSSQPMALFNVDRYNTTAGFCSAPSMGRCTIPHTVSCMGWPRRSTISTSPNCASNSLAVTGSSAMSLSLFGLRPSCIGIGSNRGSETGSMPRA